MGWMKQLKSEVEAEKQAKIDKKEEKARKTTLKKEEAQREREREKELQEKRKEETAKVEQIRRDAKLAEEKAALENKTEEEELKRIEAFNGKDKITVVATVFQVLEDGCLAQRKGQAGAGNETVYIRSPKSDCVFFQGDSLNRLLYDAGAYEYTNTKKDQCRVRAFSLNLKDKVVREDALRFLVISKDDSYSEEFFMASRITDSMKSQIKDQTISVFDVGSMSLVRIGKNGGIKGVAVGRVSS